MRSHMTKSNYTSSNRLLNTMIWQFNIPPRQIGLMPWWTMDHRVIATKDMGHQNIERSFISQQLVQCKCTQQQIQNQKKLSQQWPASYSTSPYVFDSQMKNTCNEDLWALNPCTVTDRHIYIWLEVSETTFPGCCSATWEWHDNSSNVNTSKWDCPLHRSDNFSMSSTRSNSVSSSSGWSWWSQ